MAEPGLAGLELPPGVVLLEDAWTPPWGMLLAIGSVISVVVPCLMALLFGPPLLARSGALAKPHKRVVLVIAHPDDEAMFFWPTLLQLHRDGVPMSVLCLSTGNADGLGERRSEEMRRSCAQLGIAGEDLSVVDSEKLPDGFHLWPEDVVAAHVATFVEARGGDLVLTFDSGGVSGHPNHVSTSSGVLRARKESLARGGFADVLMLETLGLQTKYLGPASLLLGVEEGASACTCRNPLASISAMTVHWSQFVWYRALFAVFSRYAYVNTYLPPPDAALEAKAQASCVAGGGAAGAESGAPEGEGELRRRR